MPLRSGACDNIQQKSRDYGRDASTSSASLHQQQANPIAAELLQSFGVVLHVLWTGRAVSFVQPPHVLHIRANSVPY